MIDPTHSIGDAPNMNEATRGLERDAAGWPSLRAAQDFDCDGKNPTSGRSCILGHHQGYHRDETGAEWLDD
ncbi:hypothetical protein EV651_12861 [Kribbella sp. VKM Ac-2571]|uniref:hypothetical protein n=1 Tax=Kribbella sp. VKM Ac-2571 TaxID=2512222 RepID=UPI00105F15FE|nr:hypothetical protein [Kribbella sp. VKM Ac-2571]TDO45672.1 hypothetical protein EV651_12861 [Kribbella sp. VKM Ac-2571]